MLISDNVFYRLIVPEELGDLLRGESLVDVDFFKKNIEDLDISENKHVLDWLFEFLSHDPERPKKLFTFMTGLSSLPVEGQLPRPLRIDMTSYNPVHPYQKAHLCGWVLDLPKFPNFDALEKAMKIALEQTYLGLA